MAERTSDRWVSITQSVLLHGAVVAALAYGWWAFKHQEQPRAAQTLGIEAVALDANTANTPRETKPPPPAPTPPPQREPEPQEPAGPPSPTPEEVAQREEAERQAEQIRKEEEQRVAEEARAAEQKRATEQREAAERKKLEDAAAKRAAEQQRAADQKRKAEEQKQAEEARQRAQQEQELQRSLEEEEHVMAARSSGAFANWAAQIQARIQRAWLRPPSARPGIDCVVYVSQVPGGEVTNVRLGTCNGDQAVRESIESAVYRASPLPPPPDPALFERNLEIRFKPID